MNLLTDAIQRAAETRPDHVAFRCDQEQLTYAELWDAAQRLAVCLQQQGVNRGDRVGVWLPRCLWSPVAVYGSLLAGAAYVPLDPSAPTSLIQSITKDCGIRQLVTSELLLSRINPLRDAGVRYEFVFEAEQDQVWATLNSFELSDFVCVDVDQKDLAYILYTSGSTGKPKGIRHTHFSGASYAKLTVDAYSLSPCDIIASHAPLHFDMSTFGYFAGPAAMATTLLLSDPEVLMPASMAETVEREKVTVWYSVPLALCQMLEHGQLEERELESLRWIVFAGEPFPMKYLRGLVKKIPAAKFSNVYGPTETNHCTHHNFDAKSIEEYDCLPIGKPWHSAAIKIVDSDDQPVESGTVGELLVDSPTSMDGYWNQTGPQPKVFLESEEDGQHRRYYRTGDLVRQDESGDLIFIGRKDRQVKVRGHRIELDAIERVLLAHPLVKDVAVFVDQRTSEASVLTAAVVPAPTVVPATNKKCSESTLRRHVAEHLPRYAVPDHFRFIDEMNRTATGKIDRQAILTQQVGTHA